MKDGREGVQTNLRRSLTVISNRTLGAFFDALDKIINDDAEEPWGDKYQRILSYASDKTQDEANLDEFISWFGAEIDWS